jgi:hypothetical protein
MISKKQTVAIFVLVLSLSLVSCEKSLSVSERAAERRAKSKIDMATAWSACSTAGGVASGMKFTGQFYVVEGSGGEPLLEQDRMDGYITLDGAVAVLCADISSTTIQTCDYENGTYHVYRIKQQASLTLLAWPSGDLIARTILDGSEPRHCFESELSSGGSTEKYLNGELDLETWMQQYWSEQ